MLNMLHLKDKFANKRIILASASPRRQELLSGLGIEFEVAPPAGVDENFPGSLSKTEIPVYLARKKAAAYDNLLDDRTVLITADTIVWCNDTVLNKPSGRNEAIRFLRELSGRSHQVITGVCIKSHERQVSFYSLTSVYFRELREGEIIHYVDQFCPYDKAGGYGIQEWIGYIGIEAIEGSYFSLVGLPVDRLYSALVEF
jgi:septum formation protein